MRAADLTCNHSKAEVAGGEEGPAGPRSEGGVSHPTLAEAGNSIAAKHRRISAVEEEEDLFQRPGALVPLLSFPFYYPKKTQKEVMAAHPT